MEELKTFRKYLKEGKQVGPLYHFTMGKNALSILKSNTLKASKEKQDMVLNRTGGMGVNVYNRSRLGAKHVSFSRNKLATDNDLLQDMDVRFELDGDKMSNKYKVQPFSLLGKPKALSKYGLSQDDIIAGDAERDESEERIHSDITDLDSYIKSIGISKDSYPMMYLPKNKILKHINEGKNIPEEVLHLGELLIYIYNNPSLPTPILYALNKPLPPQDVLEYLGYDSLEELKTYVSQVIPDYTSQVDLD